MINSKITKKLTFAFGLQEFLYYFMALTIGSQSTFFYTEYIKIPAISIALIFTIRNSIEVGSAPFVGLLIEKAHFRWGKYRSWLVIALIPFSFFYFMNYFFLTLNFSIATKIVLLTIFSALGAVSGNLLNSADTAMVCSVSDITEDRVRISRSKALGSQLSRIIQSSLGLTLLYFLVENLSTPEYGFIIALVIFIILNIIGYLTLFIASKPYEVQCIEKKKKISSIEIFRQLFSNFPLLIIFVSHIFKVAGVFFAAITAAYYYRYVVGNMIMMSVMMTIQSIAGISGAWFTPHIIEKFGSKKSEILFLSISFFCFILASIFGLNQYVYIFLLSIVSICGAGLNVLVNVLFSDAIDHGEYKHYNNLRGISMSFLPTASDLGRSLGSVALALSLSLMGYKAGMPKTPEVILNMLRVVTLTPAVLIGIALIVFLFYKLDNNEVIRIRDELNMRRFKK